MAIKSNETNQNR